MGVVWPILEVQLNRNKTCAPSGMVVSLIKGTTIHNFFKLDVTGKSSLENSTVDVSLIKKDRHHYVDELPCWITVYVVIFE